ncbi:aminoglycoside phosphotransferase family protein [Shimazuella kribbensis]|uniref:aminoglycoside phosphotransferase family protein n=1 Tax=Shimazuella kribbensis TaxID=139808 RepID=UPI001FE08F39|nr:aminoglycoside phosphotransferase family protein [Shimazuella kribbensis]
MNLFNEINKDYLKEKIPLLRKTQMIQIHKGYSSDQKFILLSNNEQKVLLKIFDLNNYNQKQSEFDVLSKMEYYDVKSSRPIMLGRLEKINKGYMIVSYMEGNDASDELSNYSYKKQFQIGMDAGIELRKMHQHKSPYFIKPWYERKLQKHQTYIDEYLKSGIKIKNDTKVLSFIEKNQELMRNRPNSFQHDDFHVGNIILKDEKLSGVIDFNRFDWGDPIHEFIKIGMFSKEISIPFCIGQIFSYHNHSDPPEFFWRLYSLYLAMCLFSSIVWTLKVAPTTLSEMMNRISTILEDHQYFASVKPKWFKETPFI